MESILSSVEMSRKNARPICQDIEPPFFFIRDWESWVLDEERNMNKDPKTAFE